MPISERRRRTAIASATLLRAMSKGAPDLRGAIYVALIDAPREPISECALIDAVKACGFTGNPTPARPLPLIVALTIAGKIGGLKALLRLAPSLDVNATSTGGETALLYSARNRDFGPYTQEKIMELLLQAGANPNVTNSLETSAVNTPLMHAVKTGNAMMVRLLLRYGANVAHRDFDAVELAKMRHEQVQSDGTAVIAQLLEDAANKARASAPEVAP